jgi:hypothetical protein
MGKKNSLNITFLVFIHLCIFITPIAVKAFHYHHHTRSLYYAKTGSLVINTHEKPCPICRYEFVTSIAKKPFRYSVRLPVAQSITVELTSQVNNFPFLHYSQRAPPID